MEREKLAIYKHKNEIIEAVKDNSVVVIEAPTGSGKTTQIPQILFEAGLNGWDVIGVTQPRRIAAFGVSSRIAYERNIELGTLVGYKMRFDDMTSSDTKIKILTDGILLEELRSDPLLRKYSVIMVDEAHERSLNIDFILGLLKDIIKQRQDLKIVISSATINAKLFSDYFNNAPIISIKTKQFPIEVKHYPLVREDYELLQKKIVDIVSELEESNIKGDILIFLPGERDIKNCCDNLNILNANNGFTLEILPLYARLAQEEQKKVFDEFPDKRKIVVATNIAETSITIDGVMHIIDPGISKLNYYNPRTFTSFLESKPISKASCDQRMGRAGRTAPGIVYRLYSEEDYNSRDEFTREEIYRTDLSEVVLRMADLGIEDYLSFEFISPPTKGAIFSAIETLISIDALDNSSKLTDLGKKMVDFPLEPRLSRILLESVQKYPEVSNNILIIIAFLSTRSPFLFPQGEEIESRKAQKKLSVKGGDFFSWINLFFEYQKSRNKEEFCEKYYIDLRHMNEIINIHSQLSDMLIEKNFSIRNKLFHENILICICSGLKQYICKKDKKRRNTYFSMTETDIRIHPGSYLFNEIPEWIIGGEIVNTGRTYIRTASVINEKIISSYFNDVYKLISKKPPILKKPDKDKKVLYTKKKQEINKIYLLDKYFEIHSDRKGNFVNVPYHIIIQLKHKKENILSKDLSRIRAKLTFRDKIVLKDSFASLLHYFDKIDLDNGLNLKWPKSQSFLYPDDWDGLYRYIKLLLKPTLPKNDSKHTGFLTLRSFEDNLYQYYLERDYFIALENALENLDKIFDSEITAWNEKEKEVMEKVYHKLLSLSEEMEI